MPNNWAPFMWAQQFQAQQQAALDERTQNNKKEVERTIDAWQPTVLGNLENGFNAGRDAYTEARGMYAPYADTGLKGFNLYADSTGANGQAGYDNAESSFRASPGYQYQVDQATDAVARKASSLGSLGSGNTMTAISDRAQNLADQDYGSWQDRLAGLGQMGYAATGAQANLTKGIGDLDVSEGQARSGVLQNNLGMKVNSIMGLEGAANAGFQNMTNQITSAANTAFKNERDDSISNSSMLPNMLMGLGNSAASILGKGIGAGWFKG